MSQLSMQDFRKFSDERSNGFGSENSDKRYVGYFSLKNDGDSAVVRFMIDSVDDLNVVFMHTVKVDGRFRAINCLRDPLQPASSCPLCSADNRPKQRIYIPLLSYERDDRGELIAVPRIWERPVFYEKRLSTLTSEYGKLSNMLFRIVRNGAAGDTNTTYTEMPLVQKEIYNDSTYVKDEHAFDNFNVIGRIVVNLNADEAREVLNGGIPDKLKRKESNSSTTSTNNKFNEYHEYTQSKPDVPTINSDGSVSERPRRYYS